MQDPGRGTGSIEEHHKENEQRGADTGCGGWQLYNSSVLVLSSSGRRLGPWVAAGRLTLDLTARMILGRATMRHLRAMVMYFSTKSAIPTIHSRSKKSSVSRLGFRNMRLGNVQRTKSLI